VNTSGNRLLKTVFMDEVVFLPDDLVEK